MFTVRTSAVGPPPAAAPAWASCCMKGRLKQTVLPWPAGPCSTKAAFALTFPENPRNKGYAAAWSWVGATCGEDMLRVRLATIAGCKARASQLFLHRTAGKSTPLWRKTSRWLSRKRGVAARTRISASSFGSRSGIGCEAAAEGTEPAVGAEDCATGKTKGVAKALRDGIMCFEADVLQGIGLFEYVVVIDTHLQSKKS